jgi:hypothetical protein
VAGGCPGEDSRRTTFATGATTFLCAGRKAVDAGLRRHDDAASIRVSVSRALGITFVRGAAWTCGSGA